ncbi:MULTISPECIES: XRE family transcriptional regulator [unclassified Streptomyces]|uniref:helix-turn-helix domain-containing protein n=1 Tax=unclassified Streptomyces TaxID=2593676 RepID=UPI00278BBD20|nr:MULTISPECIES: XRE family transcriptional regulator [unclassified Streptomyces]
MTSVGEKAEAAEVERLVEALREARADTGLSLAALAAKTPYSKSSWERYLNGKTLPPRQAVEELCALAGRPPRRALALWELADGAWSGRAAAPRPRPPVEQPPEPRPPFWRRAHPGVLVAVAVAGVVALAAGTVGVLTAGERDGGPSKADVTHASQAKGCHGADCTGKDPEQFLCGIDPVPRTLGRWQPAGNTVVKVRYGAACRAVWARIDLGKVGDRIEVLAPHGKVQHAVVQDHLDAERSVPTPMIGIGTEDLDQVRVCLVRGGERRCFR